MSYGALSPAAVLALSRGAKIAGIWMATGEGGLAPAHLDGGCDVIMPMGTAKYGVRNPDCTLSEAKPREIASHENVRMFEVKLAQGAKPGKGGILPGAKVTAEIAAIRGIPQGRDSISPNRHHDIGNVRELGQSVERGGVCVVGVRVHVQPGCIQAMKCGTGHCPTGVTASVPKLIAGLAPTDKAARVARYAIQPREEVEIIAHACGLTDPTGFRPKHVTEIERGDGGFRAPQGSD
jgi:glutamate synthase domain-containing protein 2